MLYVPDVGVEKTIQLFPDLDIPFTGLQHFLLAKVYWSNLLAEHGIEGGRVTGRKEDQGERREEGGKGMEGKKREDNGKEEVGEKAVEQGKEGGEVEGEDKEKEGVGEKAVEQGKEGGEVEGEDKEKEGVGENEVRGKEGEEVEGERGELKLEDLEPILERCKETLALSEDYGSRAYYFVNGALLSVVRCVQRQR